MTESATAVTRYFVSSMSPEAKRLAEAIRSHQEVESRLHWCLNVAFHEGACRTRRNHAPQNLNILSKIEMILLRVNPLEKTLPKKRLRDWQGPTFLAQVLGVAI